MNYLFFDVECANCLEGIGKICSFGYCLTDDHFNVLKKKDILINPAARFILKNLKNDKGIDLAYSTSRFRKAPIFPYYYNEIKKLLENPENLCVGFAVSQDVNYISTSCGRYHLPYIQFRFFDVQAVDKALYQRANPSGLDHLMEEFQIEPAIYHKSDDDAYMTMLVFKHILEKENLTVDDVIKAYPFAMSDTNTLMSQLSEKRKHRQENKNTKDKLEVLYASANAYHADLNLYSKFLWKKKFFVPFAVFKQNSDYFMNNKMNFYKRGGSFVRSPEEADYIIVIHKEKRLSSEIKAEYIDIETFKRKSSE